MANQLKMAKVHSILTLHERGLVIGMQSGSTSARRRRLFPLTPGVVPHGHGLRPMSHTTYVEAHASVRRAARYSLSHPGFRQAPLPSVRYLHHQPHASRKTRRGTLQRTPRRGRQ